MDTKGRNGTSMKETKYMTVYDLLEEIERQVDKDPLFVDRKVILQKDGEGNGYSPAVGIEAADYKPESTWAGEVYHDDEPDKPSSGTTPCAVRRAVANKLENGEFPIC